MTRSRRCVYCLSTALLLGCALSVFAVAQGKKLSDKDLFKKAEAEFAAGKLDDALTSITSARTLKKKPEKKYDDLFSRVSQQLADREAIKGEQACRNLDLVACEEQLKKAQSFGKTDGVSRLEASLNKQVQDVRGKWTSAVDQGNNDPERALADMISLRRFASHLPQLESQVQQMELRAVNSHMSTATNLVREQRWDDAAQHYNRVLVLASNHAGAKTGLNDIERLRKSFQLHAEAETDMNALDYKKALAKINAAIASAPDVPQFEKTKQKIVSEASQSLAESLERLLSKPDDLGMTRHAYLNLQQLRALTPNHPKIAENLTRATEDFGANLLQRATELENLLDYSKLGTAAVMKIKAQNLLTAATIKPEEVKDVVASFNRRRTSQMLFSVEDLAGAEPVFVQTVVGRTRSALESAELPDLRIRSLDDYRKSPGEDPIVKGFTPDGKSSTVQFVVQINNHEAIRKPSEKVAVKSQYVSGTEQIPNPEYVRLKDELTPLQRSAADPKIKKEEKLRLDRLVQQKEMELSRVEQLLNRDKLADYSYEKITYTQHIGIELRLFLRDNLTREVIASERIVVNDDRTDEEVKGVHEKDVKGARNRASILVAEQQALRELEKTVLNEITTKTVAMLPNYTRRFLREGQAALKGDRTDEAVENFISHWAFFRGKVDRAELDQIGEVILRETGFDLSNEGSRFLSLAVSTAATQ
jgi:hypothetical protein